MWDLDLLNTFRVDSEEEYPVYEVPLGEPVLEHVLRFTDIAWFNSLAQDPVSTWAGRLAVDDSAGQPERVISKSLQKYEPSTIVLSDGYAGCGIVPIAAITKQPALLYMGPRTPIDAKEASLRHHGFAHAKEIAGFSGMLAGFRELYFPLDGQVRECDPKEMITRDNFEHQFGFSPPLEWSDTVVAFTALNGDILLVNQDGMSAWVQLETHKELLLYTESVNALAMAFANYLDEVREYFVENEPDRWILPFDSFNCLDFLP